MLKKHSVCVSGKLSSHRSEGSVTHTHNVLVRRGPTFMMWRIDVIQENFDPSERRSCCMVTEFSSSAVLPSCYDFLSIKQGCCSEICISDTEVSVLHDINWFWLSWLHSKLQVQRRLRIVAQRWNQPGMIGKVEFLIDRDQWCAYLSVITNFRVQWKEICRLFERLLPYQILNWRKFRSYVYILKSDFAGCYFSWVTVEFEVLTAVNIKITAFGNITACSLIDNLQSLCRIWGSHSGDYEDSCLFGYNAMWPVENQPTFRMNMLLLPASLWFLTWLIHRPWRFRRYIPPKFRLIFNGIHGFIFQKRILFP
jgi:hypothetical protein